jgi:decaprenylphospho-beta-D-ribofuranose 2-oxidase
MATRTLTGPAPSGLRTAPSQTVTGWGGGPGSRASVVSVDGVDALRTAITQSGGRRALARGMGRSYGDAAQLDGGRILDLTSLAGFRLDAEHREVTAQAGITLGRLLGQLVPRGWTLPVLPGTQHVTVGGAIASDIHGKSHGVDGTFGSHVSSLELMTAAGELVTLEPGSELFAATVGGMGLTGVIVSARIGLAPVSGGMLAVDTDRADSLDDVLTLLAGPGGKYRVAWLDLLGPRPGRGVVTRAEHTPTDTLPGATVRARATVPTRFPAVALRPGTVRAFNELRFRSAPRQARGELERLGAHMFPLDALDRWPRLYGPSGFLQYQFVVPPGRERVLEQAIAELRRARVPCYLAVLKDFGPAGDAPLSFPIAGWTLALDLPRRAPGLDAVLDRLDELVVEAGGRIYLTKDARTRPETLAAMYPRLPDWRAAREAADPNALWCSDLALRTGLVTR